MRTSHELTDDELFELCRLHGIQPTIPYSQLEAETVHRGVGVTTIAREHLIGRLREVGVL
ncbi:MAG: hypothetical protein ACRDJW_01295 [Thermomicrobiales bacterium]